MVKLIAKKEIRYAGVTHVPGTPSAEFEASEKDAKLLKIIGKAADAPVKEVAQAPQATTAEPAKPDTSFFARKDEVAADDARGGRRRYPRRDMRAEE